MNKPIFQPERRQLLRGAGLLGLAATLPPFMQSCGDGSSGTPAAVAPPGSADVGLGRRETRHLHFDLSDAPVTAPTLFALGSTHHGQPLQTHDAASRSRHRALNPALAAVSDAKLTHYLEDADLPGGALQTVMAKGTDPASGQPVLAGVRIHVPRGAQAVVAQRAAERGAGPLAGAKRQYYGLAAAPVDPPGHDIDVLSGPLDVATFLVFHHPEVMNLKPDLGGDILARIGSLPCGTPRAAGSPAASAGAGACTPYLGTLAFRIATLIGQHGYPSTKPGSWATLVPGTDLDGKPMLDAKGQPIHVFEVEDSVAAATRDVVLQILKDIFNDALFRGSNWQATVGIAAKTATLGSATAAIGAAESFSVDASHPVGATVSGIEMVALEVADAATRRVRLTVRNRYLRFLSIYLQYQDAQGKALPIANPGTLDSPRAQYLQMVPTNDQIMGIPFQGDNVSTTDIEFVMPVAAARAVVMFGGLGLGGDAFTKEAVGGTCLTLALNIGIPTILLAAGAYVDYQEDIYALVYNPDTLLRILRNFFAAFLKAGPDLGAGIYSSAESQSCQSAIVSLGNIAIQTLFSQAPTLLSSLALKIGALQVSEAVPIVNVVIKVFSIAADLAAILVSVGESLASPAITTNAVSLKMASTVRIARDPRDFQFPASARRYVVELTYDGGSVPRTLEGTIAQGTTGPVDVPIDVDKGGVPSGGQVSVKVSFYSASNCLVGVGQAGPIANLPDTAAIIAVTIAELTAPLDAGTRYQHSLKLAYAAGARTWAPAPAPQLTRSNLCQGNDNAICALNGLTVHTATGMAGYGFDAGGQGVGQCGGGGGSGVALNTIQNVFLGRDAQQALKFSTCGYTDPVGIVYDPQGPAVGGHHFFVQPAADGFHVRGVTLDNATPFDLNQRLSWGRFSNALDSLAVLTSGYVIGVNRQTHKMEVLLLPSQPVNQDQEPTASPFASIKAGLGSRVGLLNTPVAVAGFRGAVLVLEQGNARIQALDTSGNAVNLFKGATTNLVALTPELGAIYLDLAVEGAGYMYVLSYVADGLTPQSYRLDLYDPTGAFVSRTLGVAAARLAVDLFRNLYTLNYEPLAGSPRVEPSLSQWLPVTSTPCPSSLPATIAGASTGACARPALA